MKIRTVVAIVATLLQGQAIAGSSAHADRVDAAAVPYYCVLPGGAMALYGDVVGAGEQLAAVAGSGDSYGSVLYDLDADAPRVVGVQPGIGHNADLLGGLLFDGDSIY